MIWRLQLNLSDLLITQGKRVKGKTLEAIVENNVHV